MKKFKIYVICITAVILMSLPFMTVYAAEAVEGDEGGYMDELPGAEGEEEQGEAVETQIQQETQQQEAQAEETQAQPEEQPEQEFHDRDYYYNAEENAYIEELPTIDSDEVQEATILKIPVAEITDTTLIGGIAAWLCVAVGIAVIVGVLVSKRTSNVRR